MVKLPACKVCEEKEKGKYRCPVDDAPYCSVVCFKKHKASSCSSSNKYEPAPLPLLAPREKRADDDDRPRKRLKSLEWPLEPDSALWDDPLARNDIKPLRGFEYEAIATSPRLRTLLASPHLTGTLQKLASLPRHAAPAALRVLLGFPEEPANTFYRPSPSQKFSSSAHAAAPLQNSRGGGARGRGRGRGRGGHGGGGGDAGRARHLVETTPEERKEVESFVECVLGIVNAERVKRGERSAVESG